MSDTFAPVPLDAPPDAAINEVPISFASIAPQTQKAGTPGKKIPCRFGFV